MMQITRRQFAKYLSMWALAFSAFTSLVLAGCGFIGDVESWVPVGVAALNSILTVLKANGITILPGIQTAFDDAVAALNAIKAAAQAYAATTPPPVGTLQKFQAAFAAGAAAVESFLSAINLPTGGILATIIGVAQIIFSTIAAFQNQLPPAPAAPGKSMTLSATYHVAGTTMTVVPVKRSVKGFKKDFNGVLTIAQRGGVTVPQQAFLSLTFWEHM